MGKAKQAAAPPAVALVDASGLPLLYQRYTTLEDLLQQVKTQSNGHVPAASAATASVDQSIDEQPAKRQKKGPSAAAAFLAQRAAQQAAANPTVVATTLLAATPTPATPPAAANGISAAATLANGVSATAAPATAAAASTPVDPWLRSVGSLAPATAAPSSTAPSPVSSEGLTERQKQKRAIRTARQAARAAELAAEAAAKAEATPAPMLVKLDAAAATAAPPAPLSTPMPQPSQAAQPLLAQPRAVPAGPAAAGAPPTSGTPGAVGLSRKQRRAQAAAEKATAEAAAAAAASAALAAAVAAAPAGNAEQAQKMRQVLGFNDNAVNEPPAPAAPTPDAAAGGAPPPAQPLPATGKAAEAAATPTTVTAQRVPGPPTGNFTFGFSVAEQVEAATQAKLANIMALDSSKDGFTPRRVFVCGMPIEWDEAALREYWGHCGEIESMDLLGFSDTGRFKGVLFITFKAQAAYEAALACDGEELEGRRLRVEKCKTAAEKRPAATTGAAAVAADGAAPAGRPARAEGYNVAYVGNVAYDATDADLRRIFEPVGVKLVRLHTDKGTGKSKGFAHIHFPDSASLDKAIGLDGTQLCGRPIRVTYGQPKKSDGRAKP